MSTPGWKLDDAGNVVITMTQGDWKRLLFDLGAAIGMARAQSDLLPWARGMVALVNRLNVGNPNYTPYVIPEEVTHGRT
jgi:hypothetical protein